VEESHPLNISYFSQIISHQAFQFCITNIIRIIVSIKINSDWMVVIHQLVAAFVSLVQMAQLATECRNVGESTLGRQVRLVCMLKLFTFMRTQYVCFKTILKTPWKIFPTKIILESRYQAPVV